MNSSSTSVDVTTIDELNSKGWDLNRKDPKQAIELANKALDLSEQNDYTNGIAQAKKILGACNIWLSNHEDAVDYSFAAIQLFKKLNLQVLLRQCGHMLTWP